MAASAAAYGVGTTAGSSCLVRWAISQYVSAGKVEIGSFDGRLWGVLGLGGIRVKDIAKLPPGSVLSVGKLDFNGFSGGAPLEVDARGAVLHTPYADASVARIHGSLRRSVTFDDIRLRPLLPLFAGDRLDIQSATASFPFHPADLKSFENARLRLPASDPLYFYGRQEKGSVALRFYGKTLDVPDVLAPFYDKNERLRIVTGAIEDLSFWIRGDWRSPDIAGSFHPLNLKYRQIRVVHAIASFRFHPQKKGDQWAFPCELRIRRGKVMVLKTPVRLHRSRILFSDEGVPSFDIHGTAHIEDVEITISVKGTSDKPEFRLSSDPPLPEEGLLVMIATGKNWQGTETALKEGKVSTDAAKELLDYFVFGGSAGRLEKSLGIKEFSLLYDDKSRGLEVKKGLTKRVDAIYSLETPQVREPGATTTQKLGAEYHLSRDASVSVAGQEAVTEPDKTGVAAAAQPEAGKSVSVEYKKKF